MTTPIQSVRGVRRRGQSAVWFLAIAVACALVPASFAQNEAKDRTDKATQPVQTRLPDDQAKATPPNAASSAPASASQAPDAELMKQMMEMSKLNENHKLLASLDGTWAFTIKFWMNGDPTTKPQESTGVATRKSIMDGRYIMMDAKGKVQMPGPDGKMQSMDFAGMGTEGYDNAKQKFVGTWMDNMSTGIMMAEGTYDQATKTFTYTGELEPIPGMKQKIREVVKLTDKDHMNFDWYEERGGREVKTMQIDYTRKK
jgi:hypothetical protein